MSESGDGVSVLYSFRKSPADAMHTLSEVVQTTAPGKISLTGSKRPSKLRLVKPIELETRTCTCGCKRTWRCMTTSKDKYFSVNECAPRENRPARMEFTNPERRDAPASFVIKKKSVLV